MVSDHVAVTPDVAEQYPAPFYEPFTTLSWLAGITDRVAAGHHGAHRAVPAPAAHRPDGRQPQPAQRRPAGPRCGRRLGPAGVRGARRAVPAARGADRRVPARRARAPGRTTRTTAAGGSRSGSAATATPGLRRAVRLGDAWHPLRFTLRWLREAVGRLTAIADELGTPGARLGPADRAAAHRRARHRPGPARRRGHDRPDRRRPRPAAALGADTVVLDPFNGDPDRDPPARSAAWRALAAVAAHRRIPGGHDDPPTTRRFCAGPSSSPPGTGVRRTRRSARCWSAPDGAVLVEDHNTVVSDADITAHPELKLARWAARELTPRGGRRHHDVHQLPAVRRCARRRSTGPASDGWCTPCPREQLERGSSRRPRRCRRFGTRARRCSTRRVSRSTATTDPSRPGAV